MHAILLDPVPITRARLAEVIDAGWVGREAICRHTTDHPPSVCMPVP